MKIFRNRTVIGVLCILLALIICILSLFSSNEECTYRSSVIVTEAWPKISDKDWPHFSGV